MASKNLNRAERRRAEREARKSGGESLSEPGSRRESRRRPWAWSGAVAVIAVLAVAARFMPDGDPKLYGFEVVKTYPHDRQAYTQGLLWSGGSLYESTGKYGNSTLREVRLIDGEVVRQTRLPEELFGEGLVRWKDQFIQLTWKAGRARVYSVDDLSFLREFEYEGEGWGLTSDGRHLFMSDGSAELRILDPENFKELRRIKVMDGETPVEKINELEWVNGEIWANVFQVDRIARIHPKSGKIVGWIEMSGILPKDYVPEYSEVLNGIAYDAKSDRLFVTGKFWPYLFEIRVVEKAEG